MDKVRINKDRCKGCEYCVIVCPKKVLVIDSRINSRGVRPALVKSNADCTGCGMCAVICPDVCIEVYK